jgi:hypothetical protein
LACGLASDVATQDSVSKIPPDIATKVFIVILLRAMHARVGDQVLAFVARAIFRIGFKEPRLRGAVQCGAHPPPWLHAY